MRRVGMAYIIDIGHHYYLNQISEEYRQMAIYQGTVCMLACIEEEERVTKLGHGDAWYE